MTRPTAKEIKAMSDVAGVPVELHYCEGNDKSSNGWHGRVIELCREDWTTWANRFLANARGI